MTIILYARRIAVVNGDTQQCRDLLERACQVGNTYIYIGIKVSNELYSIPEVRQICHLLNQSELQSAGGRASNIIYTAGFGLKTDPILSYVTLTLSLQEDQVQSLVNATLGAIGAGGIRGTGSQPNLQMTRQCRVFYNKNEASGRQVAIAFASRLGNVTLGGKRWDIKRVTAREDRITQYPTPFVPIPQPTQSQGRGNPGGAGSTTSNT